MACQGTARLRPNVWQILYYSRGLGRFSPRALRTPVESNMDIVLIDEIGPMEMSSRRFSAAISSFLQNRTGQIVATFKQGSHYPIVDKCLDDPSTTLLNITRENREAVLAQLTALADSSLRSRG